VHYSLRNGNNVFMPKKKPRGKQLTPEDKLENKVIGSLRMPVEHSINGIKRFGCLSQITGTKKGLMTNLSSFAPGPGTFI
jgi:hypothetical protein